MNIETEDSAVAPTGDWSEQCSSQRQVSRRRDQVVSMPAFAMRLTPNNNRCAGQCLIKENPEPVQLPAVHFECGRSITLLGARETSSSLQPASCEALSIFDSTIEQNAMDPVGQFTHHVSVTEVVSAKLDRSANGVVFEIHNEFNVSMKLVGLGETPADLEPFGPTVLVKPCFPSDE